MDSKESFEDLALKKSILPVMLYLAICGASFFVIDQLSIGANTILGANNIKLVNILEGLVIGLLTIFVIFYLVYKHKFVEINAQKNMDAIINSSPYPVLICKLKDLSISSCSPVFYNLLEYSANEIKSKTLRDLLTESSFKQINSEHQNKQYVNHDYESIHFVEKGHGLLSLSANIMKYELLDNDYLIIRCHSNEIKGSAAFEPSESVVIEKKRPFQF